MEDGIRGIVIFYDITEIKKFPVVCPLEFPNRDRPAAFGGQIVLRSINRDPIEPGIEGALPETGAEPDRP